jgi:hypothetical protein
VIYFIQELEKADGPVKIGYAGGGERGVARRLYALQIGCPYELRIIGVMTGGHREEAATHKRFSSDRLRGEWFVFTRELADYIESRRSPSWSTPLGTSGESPGIERSRRFVECPAEGCDEQVRHGRLIEHLKKAHGFRHPSRSTGRDWPAAHERLPGEDRLDARIRLGRLRLLERQ